MLASTDALSDWVLLYAQNVTRFFEDYAKAHAKMSELGITFSPGGLNSHARVFDASQRAILRAMVCRPACGALFADRVALRTRFSRLYFSEFVR